MQLADVYTVIGHYYRHKSEFDAYLAEIERIYQQRRWEALANGQAGLKDRLIARLAERQGVAVEDVQLS